MTFVPQFLDGVGRQRDQIDSLPVADAAEGFHPADRFDRDLPVAILRVARAQVLQGAPRRHRRNDPYLRSHSRPPPVTIIASRQSMYLRPAFSSGSRILYMSRPS